MAVGAVVALGVGLDILVGTVVGLVINASRSARRSGPQMACGLMDSQ